jgi:hypothetical protein
MSPFIFVFGLIGNILGFVLVSSERRQIYGFILMYKFLFSTNLLLLNLIFALTMKIDILLDSFLFSLNKCVCRLFCYAVSIFETIPSMLLVYISLERVISIKRPIYNSFLRRKRFQRIYFYIHRYFDGFNTQNEILNASNI